VLTLLVIPAIYGLVKRRDMPRDETAQEKAFAVAE